MGWRTQTAQTASRTDLTLDTALATVRAMETAEQNTRTLQAPQQKGSHEVHAVRPTSGQRPTTEDSAETSSEGASYRCSRCGGTNHSPADCRFKSVSDMPAKLAGTWQECVGTSARAQLPDVSEDQRAQHSL